MPKLFVDQTVEIDAPPFKVWEVLTRPDLTSLWAPEFSGGSPLRLESDWRVGSPVLWKDQNGNALVEGNVTALEPERLLRFTVFDTRTPQRPPVGVEDGVTLELSREDAQTILHVRQGDFSPMPDAEKFHRLSAETWDHVLPKIKQLAEQE